MTLCEIARNLDEKKVSSAEMTEFFLQKIEKEDEKINAFITKTPEIARQMAAESDARRARKAAISPLDGVPIALKDVVSTTEARTSAGSKMLQNYTPPFDATVWKKLKNAGAVLLGKTNTDEFTMGGSGETSAFGATRNPRDPERVPGGSSSGSAAAVAAGFAPAAIGTDTGGSIRQPASFCGCTGLKVSYGRVSRYGTIPMASSLDTVGPLAKTPADCAAMLEIIAGPDPRDATTRPDLPEKYLQSIQKDISGKKIGIPREYFEVDGLDTEVRSEIQKARKTFEKLGAKTLEISLPRTKFAVPAYYIIAPAEISANMARFDSIRFGASEGGADLAEMYQRARTKNFGAEVKRRILMGNYVLSAGYFDAFYRKAQKVRTLIKQDFDAAFEQVDAILAPVAPSAAFKIGEKIADPVQMYLADIFTIPASLAGICGVSVPVGTTNAGLPIGAQILGPAGGESGVLNLGQAIFEAI